MKSMKSFVIFPNENSTPTLLKEKKIKQLETDGNIYFETKTISKTKNSLRFIDLLL